MVGCDGGGFAQAMAVAPRRPRRWQPQLKDDRWEGGRGCCTIRAAGIRSKDGEWGGGRGGSVGSGGEGGGRR